MATAVVAGHWPPHPIHDADLTSPIPPAPAGLRVLQAVVFARHGDRAPIKDRLGPRWPGDGDGAARHDSAEDFCRLKTRRAAQP